MRRTVFIFFTFYFSFFTSAAQTWTMQQCMQYAVEHNHEVKRAELELDNYKAQKTKAIGSFLPDVDAGIGAQYNFGRAIDPETNTYTDVSTFYNGYSLSASLPVFDGFSRIHALKAAKASELMGRASLRQRQDQTALDVLQAYTNAAYYDGLIKMAHEKVEETLLLLKQVQLLEEVGRKSAADVAQVESQKAEADYELTRQQNLYASALLELKKVMNYPLSDSLSLVYSPNVGNRLVACYQRDARMFESQLGNNSFPTWEKNPDNEAHPELLAARYRLQTSKHEWHQARASLYPSLSLSAGLSTTYYKTLHNDAAETFRNQMKNNMGEYVGASLSIPLFNRLQTITNIRKAKNNYKIAQEAYDQKMLELTKLSTEAWNDWQGYQKQTIQMQKKVQADSLAYQLTRRQFEEGLSTAIDVHTTSSQLLNSKATLLQCRLMAIVKENLVRYYRGEKVWE